MTKTKQNITILDREIDNFHAWTRSTLSEADWLIPLSASCREELLGLLDFIRKHPLPVLLRHPNQFDMPQCRALMERIRQVLEQGVHHAVLDRLPLEEMDTDEAKALVWILCSMLERPVPQKWDGTMIYDVRDKGNPYSIGVRASVTNVGLDFHTDAPFNDFVPHYLLLLCLNPAEEGGLSRVLSLASVHNILRQKFKRHLFRLYQPFYFDRQKEHAPSEPRSRKYPIFTFDRQLRVRCNPTLVRNGYQLAGEVLDEEGEAALTVLQDVLSDESLWWEGMLERGQVQFLNNYDLAHTRTAFQDATHPALKRHLVRYWLRHEGSIFFS
ncbi:MAG TPA: TauD/TfdA family dioxygenase [Coleofasciculaceae cyanobacterium]|jgi:alpha-ketoglutarate-dependent taurine dioxygenase